MAYVANTKTINTARKTSSAPGLIIKIDEDSGAFAITGIGYKFNKTIILSLDEMPARYQAYFANFVLNK